jgi:hypothetical protein
VFHTETLSLFTQSAAAVVEAVERTLVSHATSGSDRTVIAVVAEKLQQQGATDESVLRSISLCALASHYVVASRFLAVGTPRSIGMMSFDSVVEVTDGRPWLFQTAFAAMAVYFPSCQDLRIAYPGHGSARDPLSADIVCYFGTLPSVSLLQHARRGAHYNLPSSHTGADQSIVVDSSWLTATSSITGTWSQSVRTSSTLPHMAAGLDDGRQLDEVTVFAAV